MLTTAVQSSPEPRREEPRSQSSSSWGQRDSSNQRSSSNQRDYSNQRSSSNQRDSNSSSSWSSQRSSSPSYGGRSRSSSPHEARLEQLKRIERQRAAKPESNSHTQTSYYNSNRGKFDSGSQVSII